MDPMHCSSEVLHWFNQHFKTMRSDRLFFEKMATHSISMQFGQMGDSRGCYDFYIDINDEGRIRAFNYRLSADPLWVAACAYLRAQLLGHSCQILQTYTLDDLKAGLKLTELQAMGLQSLILGLRTLYKLIHQGDA